MHSILAMLLIAAGPTLNAAVQSAPAFTYEAASGPTSAEWVVGAAAAVSQAESKLGDQARAQAIHHAKLGERGIWIVVLVNQGVRVRECVDELTGKVSPPARVMDVAQLGEEPPVLPPKLSLGNAISRAERTLLAQVLSANLETEGNVAHYDMELIAHGKQIAIRMDANSGQIQPERAGKNEAGDD